MTKRRTDYGFKPLKYKDLGALLEAEGVRLGAEHRCWGVFDLGGGDAVTLAWFGTEAQMTALRQRLETLPKAGFGFLSKRSSARKIAAALRVNDVKCAGKGTPTKRGRKGTK